MGNKSPKQANTEVGHEENAKAQDTSQNTRDNQTKSAENQPIKKEMTVPNPDTQTGQDNDEEIMIIGEKVWVPNPKFPRNAPPPPMKIEPAANAVLQVHGAALQEANGRVGGEDPQAVQSSTDAPAPTLYQPLLVTDHSVS